MATNTERVVKSTMETWGKGIKTLVERAAHEDEHGVGECASCLHWHEKRVRNGPHCGKCSDHNGWASCKPWVSSSGN